VQLVDAVLRRGHLSERALVDVCMTGNRPAHLDRCDICASRAVELGRWLDEVRTAGLEEADAAFSAERLAAQHQQILRRLEQVDRPARVISFPGQSRDWPLEGASPGIRPAWVGFAAAAGLVLGLVGGQVSSRLTSPAARVVVQATVPQTASVASYEPPSASLSDLDEDDRTTVDAARVIDEMTPHSLRTSEQLVMHSTRQGR
jgi:hypothetical protein